jgi:flagellar hook protein FlgE
MMMFVDPFITAMNSHKAAQEWFSAMSQNVGNMYTMGYKQKVAQFGDFLNGVYVDRIAIDAGQGNSFPGKSDTNLFVEGSGWFIVRKPDGSQRFTRIGDFKLNGDGALVNEAGWKVQGYLLGDDGQMVDTGNAATPPSLSKAPAGFAKSHSKGDVFDMPTTEISLWVDPSNGKFFGKYDEYKIKSDGTIVGVANKGKLTVPLFKVALARFQNPDGLREIEDNMFIPSAASGEPIKGDTGEVRKGLLEKSNTSGRKNALYLQQAKAQMEIANKLITTTKGILDEALRLIQ